MGLKPSRFPAPYLELHSYPRQADVGEDPTRFHHPSENLQDFIRFTEKIRNSVEESKTIHITFLTHGYMSHINNEKEHFYDIKDAILSNAEKEKIPHIVVLVDWSAWSGTTVMDYPMAVVNVRKVSEWVATFVMALRSQEYSEDIFIHGIGFSLGAHLMGNIADVANEGRQGRPSFNRISGLDPAGPAIVWKQGIFALFDHKTVKLRKDHADMVDVIHTSDHLGTNEILGHCDFFPNWGCTQKGIPNIGYLNVPSHIFCLKLFLHTILEKEKFETTTCIKDLEAKVVEDCPDKSAVMGYFCEMGTIGAYFLTVNDL